METERKINNEKIEELITEKVGVEIKVKRWRISENVIVISVKNEMMKNKKKLKGEDIFIENDSTWEERKIQKRINRWARGERGRKGDKGRIRRS